MTILNILMMSLASWSQFIVTIDPGHGGIDRGANKAPIIEKDIVLEIAKKLKHQIEKNNSDIQVQLTRSQDKSVSLEERVKLAHQYKSDLFVSLHANWSTSSQVSGFEFYFGAPSTFEIKKNQGPMVKDSLKISDMIVQDLKNFSKQRKSLELSTLTQGKVLQTKSVIRNAPFFVIEHTQMPAVLIEVGFISNRREARKLADPDYQDEVARLLADSIRDYKLKSDKTAAVADNILHEKKR